jgi:hypothetical protein
MQAIGLTLLVAGFFVKFATDYVDKYGKELISAFQSKLPEEIGNKLEVSSVLISYHKSSVFEMPI